MKIIQLFMMTRTVITLNKHYVVCKVLSVFCGLKDPSGWAGGGTTLPEELLSITFTLSVECGTARCCATRKHVNSLGAADQRVPRHFKPQDIPDVFQIPSD